MTDITPKEAIANLNHLYGMVAPDIQRSLDVAIKALERPQGDLISREALQGEYKTACNVLLSLEQIVRSSDGWEDSAVEAVHNAIQTAIKCMHDRPQGEWKMITNAFQETKYKCNQCQHFVKSGDDKNFCPNCGADMRKGGAE